MQVRLKPRLDEIEVMIQLLKLTDNNTKNLSYSELANKISEEFSVDVEETDIRLVYEPSIQNDIMDSEILYGSMFNYSPIN